MADTSYMGDFFIACMQANSARDQVRESTPKPATGAGTAMMGEFYTACMQAAAYPPATPAQKPAE